MTPNDGVLYIVWGDEGRITPLLERSIASVKRFHPDLPIHVHGIPEDQVPAPSLLDKARMLELSPFKGVTCYLDADTVVLHPLDFGFQQARRCGLALCINECPWARRFTILRDQGPLVEYNAGVIFFDRRYRHVRRTMKLWKRLAFGTDPSLRFLGEHGGPAVMPINDQGSLAVALAAGSRPPFVLPMNWNYRPIWHRSFFGPIVIWHDVRPVPQQFEEWNQEQMDTSNVIRWVECGQGEQP